MTQLKELHADINTCTVRVGRGWDHGSDRAKQIATRSSLPPSGWRLLLSADSGTAPAHAREQLQVVVHWALPFSDYPAVSRKTMILD